MYMLCHAGCNRRLVCSLEICSTVTSTLHTLFCRLADKPTFSVYCWQSETHVLRRTLAVVRLLRAGVNVLMLDSDCVLLRDWYRVPAALPAVHLWTLHDHTSPAGVNTGTYYVRAAHVDGPVVWALYQMVDWVRARCGDMSAVDAHAFECAGTAKWHVAWHIELHCKHGGQRALRCYVWNAGRVRIGLHLHTPAGTGAAAVQIARWHDDPAWLNAARSGAHYPIEDFEQNLVGYALVAARTGAVPQMTLSSESGLLFKPGRDVAALQRAGAADASVLALALPKPQGPGEWRAFERWAPPPSDAGIAGQLRSAAVLRRRWRTSTSEVQERSPSESRRTLSAAAQRHQTPRHKLPAVGNATAWPQRSLLASPTGESRWMSLLEQSTLGKRTGDAPARSSTSAMATFSGVEVAKAHQLVVPEGAYTTVSAGAMRALAAAAARSPSALARSVADVRDRGRLFLAAFPPVRLRSGAAPALFAAVRFAACQVVVGKDFACACAWHAVRAEMSSRQPASMLTCTKLLQARGVLATWALAFLQNGTARAAWEQQGGATSREAAALVEVQAEVRPA
jgi:hypothetical protein